MERFFLLGCSFTADGSDCSCSNKDGGGCVLTIDGGVGILLGCALAAAAARILIPRGKLLAVVEEGDGRLDRVAALFAGAATEDGDGFDIGSFLLPEESHFREGLICRIYPLSDS